MSIFRSLRSLLVLLVGERSVYYVTCAIIEGIRNCFYLSPSPTTPREPLMILWSQITIYTCWWIWAWYELLLTVCGLFTLQNGHWLFSKEKVAMEEIQYSLLIFDREDGGTMMYGDEITQWSQLTKFLDMETRYSLVNGSLPTRSALIDPPIQHKTLMAS